MDVKTVCLGILTNGEASGYDMKKCFESSFGHFFAAGYGSIYPALGGMAEQGLVDCRAEPQDGRPDRKVYTITDKGREALLKALANPRPKHKLRSEFLAILCFAHLMKGEQINLLLDNKLTELAGFVAKFDELKERKERKEHEDCQIPEGVLFVAGFGRAVAQAAVEYIEENRHALVEPAEGKLRSATG